MKQLITCIAFVTFTIASFSQTTSQNKDHKKYLKKYKKASKTLDKQIKKIEKAQGEELETETPDLYFKQQYLATMDPKLGRPTPEALLPVLQELNVNNTADQISLMPGTGGSAWVERGPNNVGGRTRALVWDPWDASGKKVWAGGVTGGLWYNNDITNSNSSWVNVSTLWANLGVTCIAFDPVNKGTMYIGTGEGWNIASGQSRGFGIWKSIDSGKTFNQMSTTTSFLYINDIVVRNESGTAVIYAAVDASTLAGNFGNSSNMGLQRSVNGGTTWSNVSPTIPTLSSKYVFADLEIAADNRLWLGSKRNNTGTDQGGGRVLYTDDGTNFTVALRTYLTTGRVEIACAPNSKNYIYALVEKSQKVDSMFVSVNQGSNWSKKLGPQDADANIAGDFTRNQGWYNLIMAVDPNDSNTVILGGIDIFRSTNTANSFTQITKWSNNNNLASLGVSLVHSDQHAITFKPGSSSTVIFGNDGGVFYTSSVSTAGSSTTAISSRNKGYNVTQFYCGDIAGTSGSNNMLAGAQDNGTHKFNAAGVNSTTEVTGGDGAYSFIRQDNNQYQVSAYVYNQYYYTQNNWSSNSTIISDASSSNGMFINPAIFDNYNLGLFTNKNLGNYYRIALNPSAGTLESLTVASFNTGINITAFGAAKSRVNSGKTRLLVGTGDGKVYITENAWAVTPSFTSKSSGLGVGSVSGFSVWKESGDTIAVTLSNYGINNIYTSFNGGTSWTSRDGNLPNIPVWNVILNPNKFGEALIATEVGIYGTDNIFAASPTWTAYTTGMGSVKVSNLRYRNSDKMIMATTFGRGVFTSDAWSKTNPIALFKTDNVDACTNQVVTLTDTSLNDPTSYSWAITPRTFNYVNGTDSTFKTPQIKAKAGTYTVKLTANNASGSNSLTKTNYIKFTDTVATSANLVSTQDTICAGNTVQFTVTENSNLTGTITNYAWKRNGTTISGTANSQTISYAAGDKIQVTLSSNKKCASPSTFNSNIDTVKVLNNVNASLTGLDSVKFCNGQTYTISVTNVNVPSNAKKYWYINNVLFDSGTVFNYTIPSGTASNSIITVKTFVPGKCVLPSNNITSNNIKFIVNPKPVSPILTRNYDTLKVSNINTGVYTWFKNGVNIGTGKTLRAPSNGTFKCVLCNNGCCSDTSAALTFNAFGIKPVSLQKISASISGNKLNITAENLLGSELMLYSNTAQVVWTSSYNGNSYELPNLVNGIYILQIKSLLGDKMQIKLLKQ